MCAAGSDVDVANGASLGVDAATVDVTYAAGRRDAGPCARRNAVILACSTAAHPWQRRPVQSLACRAVSDLAAALHGVNDELVLLALSAHWIMDTGERRRRHVDVVWPVPRWWPHTVPPDRDVHATPPSLMPTWMQWMRWRPVWPQMPLTACIQMMLLLLPLQLELQLLLLLHLLAVWLAANNQAASYLI